MQSNEGLAKVPPHSEEAERAVLGAVLLDNQALPRALEIIRDDDFYREGHRLAFRTMITLFERGEPVDLVTLTEALKQEDRLTRAGGTAYIAQLLDEVPTSVNVANYARIVASKAILRRLMSASSEILAEALEDQSPAEEVLDRAEQTIFEIAERIPRPSYVPLKDLVGESVETIEKLYDREARITGVPTGLTDLDDRTNGLQPSDLIILAARPSVGKTTLALNIARFAAVEEKQVVAIFSLEMAKEQLATRLLCAQAKVNAWEARRGRLRQRDFPRLVNAAAALYDAAVLIDDSTPLTALELRARARRIMADQGRLDLIVVDYLQLMRGHGRIENRQQEISEISRSLKGLAKELQVPVLALSQLSRKIEDRPGHRPQLADLRESGAIEQDADVVLFIHRPTQEGDEGPARGGLYELIIGKQRNGPVGTVKVNFSPEYTRFDNYSARDDAAVV